MARKESKHAAGDRSLMGFKPENDGVDHINIHSMGKTDLGRLLSHFAHTPFKHPYFASFYSMEGFWYWARSGGAEQMRYLSGRRAKKAGQALPLVYYNDFRQDIIAANYQKIIQHPEISSLMIASELPFDHYYTFGDHGLVVAPKEAHWLIQGFEDIRLALKEGIVPSAWVEAEKRYLAGQRLGVKK